MSSNQESASQWLGKRIAEAKGAYLAASVFTVISAASFVVFCWYLSEFAAAWVDKGIVQPHRLLYASLFLTGRYVFAHFASQFNYNAGNIIVSKIKKKIYPLLLNNSQLDSFNCPIKTVSFCQATGRSLCIYPYRKRQNLPLCRTRVAASVK